MAWGQAVKAKAKPKYTIEITRAYYVPEFTDDKDYPWLYWDLAMKGSSRTISFVLEP